MATKAKNRYMLIDGNALIHRGFHAIPGLTTKTGEHTGAVYGFTMILLRAIKDLKPTHIACSFDLAGPTFRHEAYADYKATRVKAAQELYDQIPRVKEVVRALNIPIFEKAGFEADDVLGTLAAELCSQNGHSCDVMIVTGDLDTLQLVNNCVKIYTLRKGISDIAVYDKEAVKERYGLKPEQMIDYKALRGDPSDNIKGVKGIGEKTAAELIQKFGSLEELYQEIKNQKSKIKDGIKPRVLQLLIDGEKEAQQSYELSKIVTNVPLEVEIPAYEFTQKHLNGIIDLFKDLEFKSLLDKLPKNYLGEHAKSKSKKIDTVDDAPADAGTGLQPVLKAIGKQDYQFIDTEKALDALLAKLEKQKEIVVDTETTSVDATSAKLVGISLSFKEGEGYYIPASLAVSSKGLKAVLADKGIDKVGHNIKYDFLTLENAGVELSPLTFDTMIASYLLNAGTRQYSLDTLAFNELGYQMQSIEELIGKGKNQISMADVDPEKVSWYASEDVDITRRLKYLFEPRLKEEGLDKIFFDIEMPLIPVLAAMERNGIKLDTKLVKKLSDQADKEIHALEKDVYNMAGEEFNLNSPKQLKEVLFEKMGLSAPTNGKKVKTGVSTAAGELEKMVGEHPIIEKILQYREIAKLQSTYLLALPELVHEDTGRIHTNYNQTIAATGRLSSTDPNLQNIPARGTGLGSEIRKAFVAEKGWKLLSIDYSQMELRIAAHLSQDKNMMEVFRQGLDIHTRTAMEIFNVPEDKVTKDMRRHAKTVNFGILYGLSAFGLSYRIQELAHMSAKEYIEKYFEAYPGVKRYIEDIKKEVNETAMVKNELGRTRKFPEIKSSQYFIRQAAERAAINFPIQSLQADVIKIAMINIHNKIKDQKSNIKMLLQVHDELVFEVKEDKVQQYVELIKPLMEEAIKLSVPVTSEAKVGDNWGEMEVI